MDKFYYFEINTNYKTKTINFKVFDSDEVVFSTILVNTPSNFFNFPVPSNNDKVMREFIACVLKDETYSTTFSNTDTDTEFDFILTYIGNGQREFRFTLRGSTCASSSSFFVKETCIPQFVSQLSKLITGESELSTIVSDVPTVESVVKSINDDNFIEVIKEEQNDVNKIINMSNERDVFMNNFNMALDKANSTINNITIDPNSPELALMAISTTITEIITSPLDTLSKPLTEFSKTLVTKTIVELIIESMSKTDYFLSPLFRDNVTEIITNVYKSQYDALPEPLTNIQTLIIETVSELIIGMFYESGYNTDTVTVTISTVGSTLISRTVSVIESDPIVETESPPVYVCTNSLEDQLAFANSLRDSLNQAVVAGEVIVLEHPIPSDSLNETYPTVVSTPLVTESEPIDAQPDSFTQLSDESSPSSNEEIEQSVHLSQNESVTTPLSKEEILQLERLQKRQSNYVSRSRK